MSPQQKLYRCCVVPEKRNNSRNSWYVIIPISAGVVGEDITSPPLSKLIVSFNLKKEFTGTKKRVYNSTLVTTPWILSDGSL